MGQDNGHQWDNDREDRASAFDPTADSAQTDPSAFDGYDLLDVPLGDLLRGERATLGKSLLDVERELRIRATYIAAIENGDVGAFQSPGFIAGYVRSYARYMGIDPEWTFRRFCDETGFRGIHGSAQQGTSAKRIIASESPRRMDPNEVMSSSRISYEPTRDSFFHRVEPGALGSIAVLAVIAMGVSYGAWAILNDIQRLNIAPIDEAPSAPLAQLDPLMSGANGAFDVAQSFDIAVPAPETGERLYRPQALEAPVLTPRDSALATINPDEVGTLGNLPRATPEAPELLADAGSAVQVTAGRPDQVTIFATRPTWLRVYTAEGSTIYEATLNAGDSFVIPEGEAVPLLRTGNAGSTYFAVNGVALGPAGPGASIARDVELTADAITASYQLADTDADPDLTEVASLIFDAAAVPDVPVVVPEQPATLAYNPTGPATDNGPNLFPGVSSEVVAAINASNALPVVVLTPDANTERPLPRP